MKISKRSKITSSKETADRKTDRRIFPTNVRYKGYMIRLDRGGDGYNVYDKHGELEDAGYASIEKAKEFVDELENEAKRSYVRSSIDEDSNWRELQSKSVLDSDGFYTDYTLYTDGQTYICMFGDKDLYEPDASYADYETESEQDAWDWFNSYTGFADEEDEEYEHYDILESTEAIKEGIDGILNKLGGQAAFRRELMDAVDAYPGIEDDATELAGVLYGRYEDVVSIWELEDAIEYMIDDVLESTEAANSSYSPELLNDLVNYYRSFDTMSSEEIWDEIVAEYNNEDLANDVLESLDDEDLDLADEEGAYDVYSSEDFEDHEDDLDHPDQEYDSAATSINSTKLPAIYRMIKLQPGTVGVDFGGGKFNNAIDYLRDQDVTLCVYDPYNRSAEHNREVLRILRANGGADFAINSNVLNVIKEPEARKGVLENIKKITKSGAPVYITVYEGRGDAKEGVTKSGYQLNRKTADYLEEIQEVFPDATRKGKLIVATNSGSVNSSTDIDTTERWAQRKLKTNDKYCYCGNGGRSWVSKDSDKIDIWPTKEEAIEDGKENYKRTFKYGKDWDVVKLDDESVNSSVDIKASSEIIWDDLDWNQQIQVMKRYIRNYKGTRIFEDFADYINKPVEDIIDSFCDAESYGDIKIPERKQLDSEYRNDDIYSSSSVDANTDEYSDILEEIREQCSTKLIHIMAQYGFDESEAKQYSRVDASIEDNQYGRIEIGCELDYDGLMRVCQELDLIVQAYDPDSYFEPVDPGIAEAWINLKKASIDSSTNIQAGTDDFPEPSLDPPEYPDPDEVDDYIQKIDLNLDAVIEIDQLGDWEYQDENYPWARCKDTKDGSWYSDEYDVFIADPVSIVERVDELLISKLPEKEGTYRIKGDVHLEYVVSNLSKYVHSYGPNDYDEDIDTDNAYVDFDFYNSNISDFRLTKI